MNYAEELKRNPFSILKASPLDTAAQLNAKMNEALLFEESKEAEQAYLTLIHPQHRLEAEMGWFPGETDLAASLIAYTETSRIAPMPDIRTESTLGTVNAWKTVLEKWPAWEPRGAAALSVCLLSALKELSTEKVLEELNRDRAKSKFPEITQQETITHRLLSMQESILKRLTERTGEMSGEDSLAAMELLAGEYQGEGPLRKYYPLEELVQEHELKMQSEIVKVEAELYELLGNEDPEMITKIFNAQAKEFPKIMTALEAWGRLTRPLRMIRKAKGIKDQGTLDMERRVCVFMDCCYLLIRGIQKRQNITPGIMSYHREHHKELVRKVLEVFFDMEESKRQKYLDRLNTM